MGRPSIACVVGLPLLATTTALVTPPLASSLWSKQEALTLLNHPLLIQLTTGDLPMGSFNRLLEDRRVLVDAMRDGAASACAELMDTPAGMVPSSEFLLLAQNEYSRCSEDAACWHAAATAAGRTIEPDDPDIRCYACGGRHLNIDCPDELKPSASAMALAAHLKASARRVTAPIHLHAEGLRLTRPRLCARVAAQRAPQAVTFLSLPPPLP